MNVPPTRAGLLHNTDVERLMQFRVRREKLEASRITRGAKSYWQAARRVKLVVEEVVDETPSVRPIIVFG